jgi:hypothetical protein
MDTKEIQARRLTDSLLMAFFSETPIAQHHGHCPAMSLF